MNPSPPGQVRIIAGLLRGSKLPVANMPGLRPSSDRARETLFNWLQTRIAGQRVLDLFAGSGALGFEAASRGAAQVVMLERDGQLVESLRASAARLKIETVQVECADALAWLGRVPNRAFDLVFLDPPFAAALWDKAVQALVPWLAPQAWVYIETARSAIITVPSGWEIYRENQTREVRHLLYRVETPNHTVTLSPHS